jgi:hypothetical protein
MQKKACKDALRDIAEASRAVAISCDPCWLCQLQPRSVKVPAFFFPTPPAPPFVALNRAGFSSADKRCARLGATADRFGRYQDLTADNFRRTNQKLGQFIR